MPISWIIAAAVGLASGVGVATVYALPLSVAFFVVLLTLALIIYTARTPSVYAASIRVIACSLLFVALGMARVDVAELAFGQSPLSMAVGNEVMLEGVVVREPEERARTTHLYVRAGDTLVLVTVDRYATVSYGDTVTIAGTLKNPESFTTEFGRTFDYPGYLKAKGVEYTMAFATVTVVRSAEPSGLGYLFTFKQNFIERLESVIAEPYSALASGLLLGMKEGLGEELERDFQMAGLTHIVVLSGYNIMLIVSFLTFLLTFMLPARIRLVVGLLAITSFALMVGLSATVVRASIMASLFLLAQTLGRSYDVLRALLVAGMVMVLINPYLLIYDVGFQLSFMATLGLILALPYFSHPGQPETIGVGIKGYIVSTIATQIAVLPLLLYHIGEVSIVSVVVNVLALPMVPIAMLLSFFTVLTTYLFASLATLAGGVATVSLWYIITIASTFAEIPFATIATPTFPVVLVFIGYGWLGFLYYRVTHPNPARALKGWTIVEEL